MTDLDTLLDGIPTLTGQGRHVTPLPGGLTNVNHRVRTDAGLDVVVRVSSPDTGLLGVDRHAEHHNTLAAAAAGVGAPVIDYLEGRGVMVVGFLPGRTWVDADVAANPVRLAAALRRLHAGPAFIGRFDMFAVREQYLGVVREHGFRMPPRYLTLQPHLERVQAAFSLAPEPLVPCHNDLLAANVLDDRGDLRIIDYEYSGMNEPSFELGNAAAEAHLDPDQLAALCTAYYGDLLTPEGLDARVARAELWGWVARYGWTLWGMIQDGMSSLDFDFWGWAMDKWEPAQELATSARFEQLLARVAGEVPR
ncbi:phosphotransferase family protein [Ornithinibacter aureus]|uniref:Phosphotransferase family protein n=1 Tax=Ornithinibacter aureus TaxID=622664 RepID=A0ABP8K6L3_9MICO|nr:choline kinase family protein [Ornithinibacter aureus]KAF0835530.1 thiamine kinase-like enzyme [Ornithinibacter aureus]